MSQPESSSPAPDEAAATASPRPYRRPRHVIRMCSLEPCHSAADSALQQELEGALEIGPDERSPDGTVAFELIDCTGLCDMAEAVIVDDVPVVGRGAVLEALEELRD